MNEIRNNEYMCLYIRENKNKSQVGLMPLKGLLSFTLTL